MTSTLEKLLYRLYCASAETCRRSSKDDCAQNAEDSILQFCVRGVSSLRCATKSELRPDLPCFAVQRAQSGRRAVEEEWASCTGVARITATTAPTNAPITSLTPAPTNTNDLAHVALGVAPVPHRRAQVRPLGWWRLQRTSVATDPPLVLFLRHRGSHVYLI